MDRRRFLQHAGTAVAAAVTVPATYYGGRSIPGNVDVSHVRGLRAAIDSLYRTDQNTGGAGIAEVALRHYFDARQMLDESEYDTRVGHDLMELAGELAVCVGWLYYDSGDQNGARSMYSEAFLLAEQASDVNLSIKSLEKMVLQSTYIADRGNHRGAARESLRIAQKLAGLAQRDSTERLKALLSGRQALAYASNGDKPAFDRSIGHAWRSLEKVNSGQSGEAWLEFVTPGEIMVHEAKGLRYLGRPAEAIRIYRESLEGAGLSARNRSNYQAQLASCLATVGDVEGAVEIGAQVLPLLADQIRSPRTIAELEAVRHSAEAAGLKDFCQMYDRVSGRSAVA